MADVTLKDGAAANFTYANNPNGRAAATGSKPVALSTEDKAVLDEINAPADVIYVTPTLDTAAYAVGDVLFATTAIAGAARANDGHSLLQSLIVIDKDDQKTGFKLHLFKANVTSGAFNGVPSISDADAANYLGSVAVSTGDYDDLGGVSVACIKNIGLVLEAVSAGTSVYGFAVAATAPTHTASGLVLGFGVVFA